MSVTNPVNALTRTNTTEIYKNMMNMNNEKAKNRLFCSSAVTLTKKHFLFRRLLS